MFFSSKTSLTIIVAVFVLTVTLLAACAPNLGSDATSVSAPAVGAPADSEAKLTYGTTTKPRSVSGKPSPSQKSNSPSPPVSRLAETLPHAGAADDATEGHPNFDFKFTSRAGAVFDKQSEQVAPALCTQYSETYYHELEPIKTLKVLKQKLAAVLGANIIQVEFADKSETPSFAQVSSPATRASALFTQDDRSKIRYKDYYADVHFEKLTEQDFKNAKRLAAVFLTAWRRYPAPFILQTKLQKIVFVKNLSYARQQRAALPGANYLIYDAEALAHCTHDDEEVIHHEYFHLAEQNLMGSLAPLNSAWNLLSPPDFTYGHGGSQAYNDPNYTAAIHPSPGFISQYSTYAPEEDRAEIFAWLMTPSLNTELRKAARRDSYLTAKIQFMRNFLMNSGGLVTPFDEAP